MSLELRAEVKELLDTMAEVYCQLGESSSLRTHPMKSGTAYTDAILKIVEEAIAQKLKLIKDGLPEKKQRSAFVDNPRAEGFNQALDATHTLIDKEIKKLEEHE